AHRFHRLPNGGQRRSAQRRGRHIVEANHRTMLRYAQAAPGQGSYGAERGHVIEGQQSSELALLREQILGELLSRFKTGERVAGLGQVDDKAGVDFEAATLGVLTDSTPARRTVRQSLGPADEGDLSMTERVQMLKGRIAPDFVVDNHRAHR